MKLRLVSLLCFFAALTWGLTSCNEEENNDFSGADNYISKFELTADGITYKGAVVDDQIIVSVPKGTSLNGATSHIVLSENATISPQPSEISNWDEEQMFVVTAHNAQRKSYVYRLHHTDISSVGDVTFTTQQEVDDFAQKGITVIEGSLTIGASSGEADEETAINNLNGLNGLKEVVYNVVINPTFSGETLGGLDNLEKVGSLTITEIPTLTSVELPALTQVGMGMEINSTKLQNVSMPVLNTVVKDFTLKGDALTTIALDKLENVGGNFTLHGTVATAQTNTMTTLALPALKNVGGSFSLQYFPAVKELNTEALTTVGGAFTFSYFNALETLDMPALQTTGAWNVGNGKILKNINIPELNTVNGAFVLQTTLPNLATTFTAPKLKTIHGNLTLQVIENSRDRGTVVVKEAYFPELESVEGNIDLPRPWKKYVLEKADFSKLRTVTGNLTISYCKFINLDSFASLQRVGGRFDINYCPNLESVSLPALKEVGSYYTINLSLSAEVDVRGVKVNNLSISGSISKLIGDDTFDGTLTLSACPKLQGFKTIGDFSINIPRNTAEDKVDNLSTVTEVKRKFTINGEDKQLTLKGLKRAGAIATSSGSCMIRNFIFLELEEITGYTDAKGAKVGGFDCSLQQQTGLGSISLPKLTRVEGDFKVQRMLKSSTIEKVDAPLLKTITGKLVISSYWYILEEINYSFKDLSGFASLESAAGVELVGLGGLEKLEDFSPLKKVAKSFSADAWSVTQCGYNATYDEVVAQ